MWSGWATLEERKFTVFYPPTSVADVFSVELAWSFYARVIGIILASLAERHLCGMIGILRTYPLLADTG